MLPLFDSQLKNDLAINQQELVKSRKYVDHLEDSRSELQTELEKLKKGKKSRESTVELTAEIKKLSYGLAIDS